MSQWTPEERAAEAIERSFRGPNGPTLHEAVAQMIRTAVAEEREALVQMGMTPDERARIGLALTEALASGMGTRGPTITRDEAVIIERLVDPVSSLIRAAVAGEREACAKIADEIVAESLDPAGIAMDIRARGQNAS